MNESISNEYNCSSLQWLRGDRKNVELELETIRNNIRSAKTDNNNGNLSSLSHPSQYSFKTIVTNVKSVLKNARLVRPILITCGLMIFQRFTGNFPLWSSINLALFVIVSRRKQFRILRGQDFQGNILRNEPTFRRYFCCVRAAPRFHVIRTSHWYYRSNSAFDCLECVHVVSFGKLWKLRTLRRK